jgi:Ran GTPase-activating protein (RanGAP) involved in mRNA processing and transport
MKYLKAFFKWFVDEFMTLSVEFDVQLNQDLIDVSGYSSYHQRVLELLCNYSIEGTILEQGVDQWVFHNYMINNTARVCADQIMERFPLKSNPV